MCKRRHTPPGDEFSPPHETRVGRQDARRVRACKNGSNSVMIGMAHSLFMKLRSACAAHSFVSWHARPYYLRPEGLPRGVGATRYSIALTADGSKAEGAAARTSRRNSTKPGSVVRVVRMSSDAGAKM